MNIGITGASGFIGGAIVDLALRRGHEVVAFTRNPARPIPGCEMRRFSLDEPLEIQGCEAIIHLAAEPILGVWTKRKRQRIVDSRLLGTRRVAEAIFAAKEPPEVFVSGSAIGFYGDAGERELTELSPAGSGFLAETTMQWEAEAQRAANTRVVLMRTAVVLGRSAGILKMLVPLFRLGLGAKLGSGTQWMSWIHIVDAAKLALLAIENMDIRGPLNASAPWPVRNSEFTRLLAHTLRRPAPFRVPAFALRALGGLSDEALESKRVLPAVATEHQFGFQFPDLAPALANLVG
jgi:uncharacterized protein (TIGR01777 family)